MTTVLDILKESCCGLTRKEFLAKAKVEGIQNPLDELKKLIDKGLVRIDEHPEPMRFKATPTAFA